MQAGNVDFQVHSDVWNWLYVSLHEIGIDYLWHSTNDSTWDNILNNRNEMYALRYFLMIQNIIHELGKVLVANAKLIHVEEKLLQMFDQLFSVEKR